MNKQELRKRIKDLPFSYIWNEPYLNKEVVLETFKHLDEPQKPVVPQFVADYIERTKEEGYHLLGAMGTIMTSRRKNLYEWFYEDDNIELFARAWIFGYEVDEKRYEVILCNGQSLKTVYRQGEDRLDFEKVYGDLENFTRKQLEDANFGWVFDCEGIEIKEAE